jgi:hypothetical protein
MDKVILTHEFPPIPIRTMDWRAGFDGREEEGTDAFGPTRLAALVALYHETEDHHDTLACIAAILREQGHPEAADIVEGLA